MPLLVDEILLKKPGMVVNHINLIFPVDWQVPLLYIAVVLLVSLLLRIIAIIFNIIQARQFSCISKDIIFRIRKNLDHVHLLVSVPPHLAPSRVMQAIKGKTSHHLLMNWRRLREEFWGRHLWSRGYFVCSSGNVTDEMIAEYIKNQDAEPQDDDRFKVTE